MRLIKTAVIALTFLCVSQFVNAAPGGPGGGGPDPDPSPNGTGVPLDLGIGILVAAGLGYSAKKRRDAKMKEKNTLNK